MKDIYETIMNHRSIRKYKNEDVKEEDLQKLLDLAVHIPTSMNGQQYSIVVVKDREKKEKLAEAAGKQKWIAEAPVFLVFLSDYSRVARIMERKNREFKNIDSIEATLVGAVDCGIAFGTIMTMAEAMGYGIVPIGSVRRDPKEVIDILKLPKYVYPIVGMCIGVPDEDPMLKPRFPKDVIIHNDEYREITDDEIDEYDNVMIEYMDKRTEGQDVRSYSDSVSGAYSRVYFPKVNATLKEQGYSNEK